MCTGITLRADDGTVVYGRTTEWGSFDLNSRLLLIPRGYEYVGETPEGRNGKRWNGRYAIVGIDMLEQLTLADGMNEKGLAVGLFYHPDFAEYAEYDPAFATNSMAPTDICHYLLSTCVDVAEASEAFNEISVVNVIEKVLGIPAPIHLMVTDPSGEQIIVEWTEGKHRIYDSPLGVITNAPTYDWHLINLRNYVNISPVALPGFNIDELDFRPLGGGSGMIGLPGDFTPPSRFVRAVAFSKTARFTPDGSETIYELFRILDSFNVPVGAAEGSDHLGESGLRSSTQWTTAHDLKERVMFYHTQHNRQIRKVNIGSLNFDTIAEQALWPLDEVKAQNIEDRTPQI